jgi:hypothetical protein
MARLTLHLDKFQVEVDAQLVDGVATIEDELPFDPMRSRVHHVDDHWVRDCTVRWAVDDGFTITYRLQPDVDEAFAAARRAREAVLAGDGRMLAS